MTLTSLSALFFAMLIVAIVPGPAVFAIIARSFASGFMRGFYMTMGIVFADYIFISLALFGLTALAQAMGSAFVVIKYASAAYLVWLGIKMLKAKVNPVDIDASTESSRKANFLAGLLITLGNPKAILFYVGLFPAFVDVGNVAAVDVFLIMAAATLAFGSVNLCYAFLAIRAKRAFKSPKANRYINKTAGSIMVSSGLLIAAKG
jgi:threonine/homoserine/homoserine lactone efflux protein